MNTWLTFIRMWEVFFFIKSVTHLIAAVHYGKELTDVWRVRSYPRGDLLRSELALRELIDQIGYLLAPASHHRARAVTRLLLDSNPPFLK